VFKHVRSLENREINRLIIITSKYTSQTKPAESTWSFKKSQWLNIYMAQLNRQIMLNV